MKYLKISIIALLATVLVSSCKKEDPDSTKPVVNLIAPGNGDTLHIGGEHGVHFDCEFSDNIALKSYKIEIHNNFDGHHHEKADGEHTHGHPFSFNKTWTFEAGKKNADIHHHEIKIPETNEEGEENAEGKYHFGVFCTDEAGNESHVYRDVILSHEGEEHHHEDGHEG